MWLALAPMPMGCSSKGESELRQQRAEVRGDKSISRDTPDLAMPAEPEVVSTAVRPSNDAAPPDAKPEAPLGSFQLTYYWMARESSGAKDPAVQLFTRRCKPLAKVSRAFAHRLALEGTGMLRDGRTINVSGECRCDFTPCFFEVGRKKRWGVGVGYRPLSPFRSVAVDPETVPIGSMLYIPELDGLTVPGRRPTGGFVHDGCVIADDTGGNVSGNQLDLFVALKPYYEAFDRRHRMKTVTVFDGRRRCKRDGNKLVPVNRNSI